MGKKHKTELEEYLQKCLCPVEKPFKSEYAGAVVLKTYDLQSIERIWTFAITQNLTLNRFTNWKFCALMHKILHEGHPCALRDSIKYKDTLIHCAQLWTKRNDSMSICIASYCKLLQTKLLFHQTYTSLKGNLELDYDLPLRDINICFQLCLDLFDYLEDLLHLQRVIFANMQQQKISVESKKGMCRLASLVTIIAECNLLYQHSITILRLLLLQLSPDDISGLCDRFKELFKELKLFYDHVRVQQLSLHYCLVIPELPAILPNLCTFAENQQQQQQQQQAPSAPLISDLN